MAKKRPTKAVGGAAADGPGGVTLTAAEVRELSRLLEGVMTLASHGILFRFGQSLGEPVVAAARARGGPLEAAGMGVLRERGWVGQARLLRQKVQVTGSLEVNPQAPRGEPTCHILRGILQRVLETSRGPLTVREGSCQSTGAPACVFEAVKGGRG